MTKCNVTMLKIIKQIGNKKVKKKDELTKK